MKAIYINCPSCKRYRHGPLDRAFVMVDNKKLLRDRPVGCPQENTPDKPHRYDAAEQANVDQQIAEQM